MTLYHCLDVAYAVFPLNIWYLAQPQYRNLANFVEGDDYGARMQESSGIDSNFVDPSFDWLRKELRPARDSFYHRVSQ